MELSGRGAGGGGVGGSGAVQCGARAGAAGRVGVDGLERPPPFVAGELADKYVLLLGRSATDPVANPHLYILDRAGGAMKYENELVTNRGIEDINIYAMDDNLHPVATREAKP